MNIVFIYYDNPKMLETQIECWNTYPDFLTKIPQIILVDDGSPGSPAGDVVRRLCCSVPIMVFRIKEDIPWNMPGARNLGCRHAEGWIYMSDIDTLLKGAEAKKLFEGNLLDDRYHYMPHRLWLPDYSFAEPAIVNLLYHKSKYNEVGGYDEDYAGLYGKEDFDFVTRLERVAPLIPRNDVTVLAVPPRVVRDARTRGLVRDRTKNNELFLKKEAMGFPKPINSLRFSWERVL
jgi:hypothetical protein